MNLNDILEIEQRKYCYEQAYAMHRQADMPCLFVEAADTLFSIPSAGDFTLGWDRICEKFVTELPMVSPNEDSYHTGWQICTPMIWETEENKICGLFPTFGYLILSMDPQQFHPPYQVLSTLEFWNDSFENTPEGWKIKQLQAQFMMGQSSWSWDPSRDDGYAVKQQLREIPHPFWGKSREQI